MIIRNAAFALVLLLAPSMASAFWDVETTPEDVFGNSTTTATSFGDNRSGLRFECETNEEPFVAFLVRDGSGDFPAIPAQFVHVDQNGDRHITDATLTPWNDTYVAVQVRDGDTIRRLAEHMKVATGDISLGVSVPSIDWQVGDTFSSSGSTHAGSTILANCFSEV